MRKTEQIQLIPSWVESFMEENQLFPKRGKLVVALSGGLDSMVLLQVLSLICCKRKIELLAVHVNHQTRSEKEHSRDVELIRRQCEKLGVAILIEKVNGGDGPEHPLRIKRYDALNQHVGPLDCLYLAHHIDDSFEWHLMSKLKGASPVIGIPLVNGKIRRPLMCLTREQIENYASTIRLEWSEDLSNENERFDRNYLRKNVIAPIKKRYPGYLRNYVMWANKVALEKGEHRLSRKFSRRARFWPDLYGGTFFWFPGGALQARLHQEKLSRVIHEYSSSERGKVAKQLEKLWKAQRSGKVGPIDFSGGVKVLCFRHLIYICNNQVLEKWRLYDLENYEKYHGTQIPEDIFNLPKQQEWARSSKTYLSPFGLSKKKNHPLKGRGWSEILMPKTTKLAKKQGLTVLSLGKLVQQWS